MSILTELKKLTKKTKATVISQALPDSLDGDGSGSGGGVLNVMNLAASEDFVPPSELADLDDLTYYSSATVTEITSTVIDGIVALHDVTIGVYHFDTIIISGYDSQSDFSIVLHYFGDDEGAMWRVDSTGHLYSAGGK